MKDLSIIIVSYNVKSLLLSCLKSIFDNNESVLEVILVDNASSDGTVEAVEQKFQNVQIIKNKINLGFPAANNQALTEVKGKYILLLNPDTEIRDDALRKMIDYTDNNADVQILGPRLLNADGTLQQSIWRFPTLFNVTVDLFYLHRIFRRKYYPDENLNSTLEVDSVSGAALLFRKELLNTVGLLDETLFWIEDVDFCYRVKKKGLRIVYFPSAEIVHYIGQSARKNYTISLSNQIFNKVKFFKKYYSALSTFILIIISYVHCILKLMVFSLLSPFKITFRRKATAYLYMLPKIFNPPSSIS